MIRNIRKVVKNSIGWLTLMDIFLYGYCYLNVKLFLQNKFWKFKKPTNNIKAINNLQVTHLLASKSSVWHEFLPLKSKVPFNYLFRNRLTKERLVKAMSITDNTRDYKKNLREWKVYRYSWVCYIWFYIFDHINPT